MSALSSRDLLRLYRIRDTAHFLPLPLAGWVTNGHGSVRALVGGVVGWAFGLAYAASINQAFDDRLDLHHAGKNPVGFVLDRRQAILLSIPPAIACLVVVALLAPAGLTSAIVLLGAATVYSAPPRVKQYPVLGTLWNLAVGLPGLWFAAPPDFGLTSLRLLVGVFSLLLLISQLIHEAEDREDDRRGGIGTVATVLGVRGALMAATALLVALPFSTLFLATGLSLKLPLTLAAGAFAVGWGTVLLRRVLWGDATHLRRDRLVYRGTALAFGSFAFLSAIL